MINLRNNPPALNGSYNNLPGGTGNSKRSMWNVLARKGITYDTTDKYAYVNSHVQFSVKDNKTLVTRLYVDTSFMQQIMIKGRFKNDYFSVRRKVKYFGLPFIYLTFSDYKLQLGRDNDRLYLDEAGGRFGWIFFLSGGGDYTDNHVYEVR